MSSISPSVGPATAPAAPPESAPGAPAQLIPARGSGWLAACRGRLAMTSVRTAWSALLARVAHNLQVRQKAHDMRQLAGLRSFLVAQDQIHSHGVQRDLGSLSAKVGTREFAAEYRRQVGLSRARLPDSQAGRQALGRAMRATLTRVADQVRQHYQAAGTSTGGQVRTLADLGSRQFNHLAAHRLTALFREGALHGFVPAWLHEELHAQAIQVFRERGVSVGEFAESDSFKHQALLDLALERTLSTLQADHGRGAHDETRFQNQLVDQLAKDLAQLSTRRSQDEALGTLTVPHTAQDLDKLRAVVGTPQFAPRYNALAASLELHGRMTQPAAPPASSTHT